jgi:hypothetical protein
MHKELQSLRRKVQLVEPVGHGSASLIPTDNEQ